LLKVALKHQKSKSNQSNSAHLEGQYSFLGSVDVVTPNITL